MDHVNDQQELSYSPPNHSYSPPTPFIRNGIRYNEFREMLNTAVQATQHDRPMQPQPEVLGTNFVCVLLCTILFCHFIWSYSNVVD